MESIVVACGFNNGSIEGYRISPNNVESSAQSIAKLDPTNTSASVEKIFQVKYFKSLKQIL